MSVIKSISETWRRHSHENALRAEHTMTDTMTPLARLFTTTSFFLPGDEEGGNGGEGRKMREGDEGES